MLLAHKPHPLPIMSPNITHRRHPSAPPAVVVQATKTPGLLFISKQPSRASTPRINSQQPQSHPQKHQFRSSRPKGRTSQPQIAQAHTPDDSAKPPAPNVHSHIPAEKKLLPPATPSPDKSARGRQSKTPKDKGTTRSSSQAQVRRNNARQPSPPILPHVEGPIYSSTFNRNNNPASNSFDPFLVSSDSDSDNHSPTAISSTVKNSVSKTPPPPSGKFASRRRPQITTPTPLTRAVPVPRSNNQAHRPNISRSAPSQSPVPVRDARRASATYATEFPVCDDTTDVDDDTSPSTPLRGKSAVNWQQLISEQGPRTAPLNMTAGFSFGGHPSYHTPSPSHRHHRTPSEGVFNMSFDEDMSSTSDISEEQKKLFGSMPRKYGSVGPSAARVAKDKTGFFASSVFQNSPSPDELPPPAF